MKNENTKQIVMASSKKEAKQIAGVNFEYVGVFKYERNPIKGRGNHFYEFKPKNLTINN